MSTFLSVCDYICILTQKITFAFVLLSCLKYLFVTGHLRFLPIDTTDLVSADL